MDLSLLSFLTLTSFRRSDSPASSRRSDSRQNANSKASLTTHQLARVASSCSSLDFLLQNSGLLLKSLEPIAELLFTLFLRFRTVFNSNTFNSFKCLLFSTSTWTFTPCVDGLKLNKPCGRIRKSEISKSSSSNQNGEKPVLSILVSGSKTEIRKGGTLESQGRKKERHRPERDLLV